MLMPRSSDLLSAGACTASGTRLLLADVTDTARALAGGHLCGPTAALVQAECLAGVALLSADLQEQEEAVILRLRVSGPVGGALVEATIDGCLRGYAQTKILNALDGRESIATAEALGESGEAGVVRSLPGRRVSQAAFEVRPASVAGAVQQYFECSLQRPAFVRILAMDYGGNVDLARGLLVERLPDGDRHAFARVRALFDEGAGFDALESAAGLDALAEELGLGPLRTDPPRPLRFGCRCSGPRAESTLRALTDAALDEMVRSGKPATIHCHMCGASYTVSAARLAELARTRPKT
jgi:molecular chaperone Hsp33